MVFDRTKDLCILSWGKSPSLQKAESQDHAQPWSPLRLNSPECSKCLLAGVFSALLVFFSLLWRQDMMLREVAGVEVSSIAHISALEEGLDGQERNVSSELTALKEEIVLSSEWVSSIQKKLAKDSHNASHEVSGIRTRLASMAARIEGLERSLAEQNASASEQISRLEADVAKQERAASDVRWLAKQHKGVLAVEEALAKQIDRQRSDASANEASAAERMSGLEGQLAVQKRSMEKLQVMLEEERRERFTVDPKGLHTQDVARLRDELGKQRAVDADLAATVKRQDAAVTDLRSQLKRQRTVSDMLEADLDREERRYLDLEARVDEHNGSSSSGVDGGVKVNLSEMGREIASHDASIASLRNEFEKEKVSEARQETMLDGVSSRLNTQQNKLAAVASSAAQRDNALQAQLSHQQQDAELRGRAVGEMLSRQAATQSRVAHLEAEVSGQREAQAVGGGFGAGTLQNDLVGISSNSLSSPGAGLLAQGATTDVAPAPWAGVAAAHPVAGSDAGLSPLGGFGS